MTITGVVYLPGCRGLSHHICRRRREGGSGERGGHHGNRQTHKKVIKMPDVKLTNGKLQPCKWPKVLWECFSLSSVPFPPSSLLFILLCRSFFSCSSCTDHCVLALLLNLFFCLYFDSSSVFQPAAQRVCLASFPLPPTLPPSLPPSSPSLSLN